MGVIVGNGESKLRCDHPGCNVDSEYVSGYNDGQSAVEAVMRGKGWQCCSNGKTYCPDHAYGRGIGAAEANRREEILTLVKAVWAAGFRSGHDSGIDAACAQGSRSDKPQDPEAAWRADVEWRLHTEGSFVLDVAKPEAWRDVP